MYTFEPSPITGNDVNRIRAALNLLRSDFADVLIGNGGQNGLYGYIGNDRLRAKGGSDWIYAGPGKDYLDGGPGNDYLNGEKGKDTCVHGERERSCP